MKEAKHTSSSKTNNDFAKLLLLACKAGFAEVVVDHPLWVLKVRQQGRYAFTLDPRILYRGIFSNAILEMGITTLQYCTSYAFYQQNLVNDPKLNGALSSILGGIASSAINNPAELGLTQQQKKAESITFPNALKDVVQTRKSFSAIYTGNVALIFRNSLYTYGFFSLAPAIKTTLLPQEYHHNKTGSLACGMLAGTICSLLSQPFDNIKTVQHDQALKGIKFFDASKKIYQEAGISGFYIGTSLRTLRILIATGIIHTIIDQGEPLRIAGDTINKAASI